MLNQATAFTSTNYLLRVALDGSRYLVWFTGTWVEFGVTAVFSGLGIGDLFSALFFAFGGSVVLLLCLIFCMIANSPLLVFTYRKWAAKRAGGLGLANFINGGLFDSITKEQVDAAKEFLGRDIASPDSKDSDTERYFNYDAAKLLLQLAAIVYEHRNESIRTAIQARRQGGTMFSSVTPDHRSNASNGVLDAIDAKVKAALANYGNDAVSKFCTTHNLEFEPLSELNDTSSAFAGVFWEPKSNWIVVSFKGTSPIEFGELLSDFDAKMVSAGSNIPGFKKVHRGFLERVYPEDVTKTRGVRPYDTILKGVKALAKWLRNNNGLSGSPKINIWFTGHSLGCATASLVYSRMLMRPKDLGEKSVLRDAYMFAAPILADRDSVDAFNSKMLENPKEPRTMWRITSNWDAVATLLPAVGDYRNIPVSPNNAFGFAHLGTELKLRDYPKMPTATGNHLYYGVKIGIKTKYALKDLLIEREKALNQDGEKSRIWWARLWQKLPTPIGRLIAHAPPNYWDQLNRTGLEGDAEWVKPNYFWW
ncbi:alpha/beta-hydrolase [Clavulina sp. PMI_390]|nr:alpha/beta-hydrolase [Clavulina sp. PMI_390]